MLLTSAPLSRFITAMAANPLAVNLAATEGLAISWGTWALAGLMPGLICLVTVPLILYALYPPGARRLSTRATSAAMMHQAKFMLVLWNGRIVGASAVLPPLPASHYCAASVLPSLRPAETKDTPDAPAAAKKELEKLGPLSRDEKITAAAFLVTVALWIGGSSIGVNSVAAAIVGLSILLITGAQSRGAY
jgi:di/tricarboxylate transporter